MREMECLDIFANNLKSLMSEQGITQQELADEAGLAEGSVSSYVNGKKMPGVRALVNIAYVLDCDIQDLIPVDERIY